LNEKGSVLPLLQDIIEDISTFMSSTKITPRLLWFMTKLMKTITNSLWDLVEEKIDDYYTKVNCHNKAMGLWALFYVRSEKMIKKEKECNEENDNNSTISNK